MSDFRKEMMAKMAKARKINQDNKNVIAQAQARLKSFMVGR